MKHVHQGNILKMKSHYQDSKTAVNYELPMNEELVAMNPLIGKKMHLEFTGRINDIETGEVIKKSYGQGYGYKSFITLAQCDMCIVKPELCHYAKGTCRQPDWGLEHCFQPHIIYLANTGNMKIGITRKQQVPTRWIDQGATSALPILEVPDRLTAGLIEVEIAKEYPDKTDWREMLKGEAPACDLKLIAENIFNHFGDLFDDYKAKEISSEVFHFSYPVLEYPKKVTSLNLDKNKTINSRLLGIKGQYLIFEKGVINLRKYQGYEMQLFES